MEVWLFQLIFTPMFSSSYLTYPGTGKKKQILNILSALPLLLDSLRKLCQDGFLDFCVCSADVHENQESSSVNGFDLIFSGWFQSFPLFKLTTVIMIIITTIVITTAMIGKNTKDCSFVWDMIIIVGNYAFDSFPGKNMSLFV